MSRNSVLRRLILAVSVQSGFPGSNYDLADSGSGRADSDLRLGRQRAKYSGSGFIIKRTDHRQLERARPGLLNGHLRDCRDRSMN